MDSDEMLRAWNEGIELERPVYRDSVERILAPRVLERVFDDVDWWMACDLNFAIKLPMHAAARQAGLVQAIVLVFAADYFASGARIPMSDLEGLEVLGVPVPCSAAELAGALGRAGVGPLEFTAQSDYWTIVCCESLIFEFRSPSGTAVDPGDSRLVSMEFNFGPAYSGERWPDVRRADRRPDLRLV